MIVRSSGFVYSYVDGLPNWIHNVFHQAKASSTEEGRIAIANQLNAEGERVELFHSNANGDLIPRGTRKVMPSDVRMMAPYHDKV